MYIFSIDIINLRNKTLVFAHWAAGETCPCQSSPQCEGFPVYPGRHLLCELEEVHAVKFVNKDARQRAIRNLTVS